MQVTLSCESCTAPRLQYTCSAAPNWAITKDDQLARMAKRLQNLQSVCPWQARSKGPSDALICGTAVANVDPCVHEPAHNPWTRVCHASLRGYELINSVLIWACKSCQALCHQHVSRVLKYSWGFPWEAVDIMHLILRDLSAVSIFYVHETKDKYAYQSCHCQYLS